MEIMVAMQAMARWTVSPVKAAPLLLASTTLPAGRSTCAASLDGRSALAAISAVLKQMYDSCRRSELPSGENRRGSRAGGAVFGLTGESKVAHGSDRSAALDRMGGGHVAGNSPRDLPSPTPNSPHRAAPPRPAEARPA